VSASGNADTETAEGPWTSFVTTSRLLVGWFCVAIGLLNLLVEFDREPGSPDAPYLLFHAVLVVGGMVLLALASIRPNPGPVGYAAGAAVTAVGMIASAVPATTTVCCLSAFAVRHGFPFTFVARNAGVGDAARWHIDSEHTIADLLFWGFGGLFTLVLISLLRRVREPDRESTAEPEPAAEEPREYIEHRGSSNERAPDRTVGPLP